MQFHTNTRPHPVVVKHIGNGGVLHIFPIGLWKSAPRGTVPIFSNSVVVLPGSQSEHHECCIITHLQT